MSRTEKLFQRLDALEAEYLQLARKEFAAWLHGHWSGFLARMYRTSVSGTYWMEQDNAEWMRLEKEIESLRLKLDQPLAQSPVGAVRELFRKLQMDKTAGSGMEFPLVKEFLKQSDHKENA